MAQIAIYDKSGNYKLNSHGDRVYGKMKYVGQTMSISYLEFNISSAYPIAWNVGDYVDWGAGLIGATNLRFMLFSIPQPKKEAEGGLYGGGFVYSGVQFHDAGQILKLAPFTDMQVENDNLIHYSNREGLSTYENVEGIAARIEACINAYIELLPQGDPLYGISAYVHVDTDPTTQDQGARASYLGLISEPREFSLAGTVFDALNDIGSVWPTIGWGYEIGNATLIITIGAVNFVEDAGYTAEFSRHAGIVSLRKYITNQNDFFTRLIPYGSDRNLISRFYNGQSVYNNDGILNGQSADLPCLMLPIGRWGKTSGKWDWNGSETARLLPDPRKAFVSDANIEAKYGVIPKIVRFNNEKDGDIYPSLSGVTVDDLWAAMSPSDDYYPDTATWEGSERIDKIDSAPVVGDNGVFSDDGSNFKRSFTKAASSFTGGSVTIPSGYTIPLGLTSGVGIHTADFKADVITIRSDRYLYAKYDSALQYTKAEIQWSIYNGNTQVAQKIVDITSRMELYEDENGDTWYRAAYNNLSLTGFLDYIGAATEVVALILIYVKNPTSASFTLSSYAKVPFANVTFINSSVLEATTHIHLRQIGFDVKDRFSDNDGCGTLNMKTGFCAGRSFKIINSVYEEGTDTWDIEIERAADTSTGMVYPNDIYPISADDEFVLTDIQMPDLYVASAAQRLYDAAMKYYSANAKLKYLYDLEIDSKWIHGQTGVYLRPGMYMQIADSDLIGESAEYVLIDTVTITENDSNIPTFKVTLREKLYLPE